MQRLGRVRLNLCIVYTEKRVSALHAGEGLKKYIKRGNYMVVKYQDMAPLDYLKLSKGGKAWCRFYSFFLNIPDACKNLVFAIGRLFKRFGLWVAHEVVDIINTFRYGDWKTRLSFVVMGFANLSRRQIVRGVIFLAFEIAFIVYMCMAGGYWLGKISLYGLQETYTTYETVTVAGIPMEVPVTVYGDNTLKILIYSVLTIFFIIAFAYTWRLNVKQAKLSQQYLETGKRLKTNKEDLKSVLDSQFNKTVLALPMAGILFFTVMPIIVMILIAFTNFDVNHTPPTNQFSWVGWTNFGELFNIGGGSSSFAATFGEILAWTLVWAFFATFSNYFLGMFVAMMINKKGIKFKKLWRGILVLTIAIPQFISLLFVSKLFDEGGMINTWLYSNGFSRIPFWTDGWLAKVMVIVLNIWVGIPYLMLITTGVLMNIPADLYESARIDGANGWQMYCKITLPYMLFVTGPYLLTSFTNNMNNFNVIYLLSGGGPFTLYQGAGETDLLITWLYRLTVTNNDYSTAAVIGCVDFIVVAVVSLIVYNIIPSTKNEEDFQ